MHKQACDYANLTKTYHSIKKTELRARKKDTNSLSEYGRQCTVYTSTSSSHPLPLPQINARPFSYVLYPNERQHHTLLKLETGASSAPLNFSLLRHLINHQVHGFYLLIYFPISPFHPTINFCPFPIHCPHRRWSTLSKIHILPYLSSA